MAVTDPFIVRERKRQVAKLEKRKQEIEQRIADMRDAVTLIDQQIAEHKGEIKRLEAPPK